MTSRSSWSGGKSLVLRKEVAQKGVAAFKEMAALKMQPSNYNCKM